MEPVITAEWHKASRRRGRGGGGVGVPALELLVSRLSDAISGCRGSDQWRAGRC